MLWLTVAPSSSSLKGNRGILITVQRVIPTLLRGVECRRAQRIHRSRNGGNQRKRLAARLGEVESRNEREIHATSSSIRGLAREEKGASYALSASARPATGAAAGRRGRGAWEGRGGQHSDLGARARVITGDVAAQDDEREKGSL